MTTTTAAFTRMDPSHVGRWWWTVDRWLLMACLSLFFVGLLLNFAAGPPAAERIGAPTFHFVERQAIFLPLSMLVVFAVSLLDPLSIRRLAVIGFAGAFLATLATLVIGAEVKGASRWIWLGPFSLQPSEFLKPCFAVFAAWMFAERARRPDFPGYLVAGALLMMVAALLLSQPDVGMTMVVTLVWCAQFFIAGLPLVWVAVICVAGMAALAGAYLVFPHVASRVDRFLDPASGDTYQIRQATRAFHNGGFFGAGPGEGRVKEALPDAHTDFIFAVAGEEFGLIFCLVIVALFAFVVLRALDRARRDGDLFVALSVGGLAVQFGAQALINMGSSLNMIPTKGMTLPFVSYGGSSALALALGMGMLLGLTRRRASAMPLASSFSMKEGSR